MTPVLSEADLVRYERLLGGGHGLLKIAQNDLVAALRECRRVLAIMDERWPTNYTYVSQAEIDAALGRTK